MKKAATTNGLLSHPSTYFFAAWSLCAFLVFLDLIPRITQYWDSALVVFAGLVAFNLLGVFIAWFVDYDKRAPAPLEPEYRFPSRSKLLAFWIIGSFFEIIVSEGLPILWVLTGNSKTYGDFGIPSIHGVMNAIYLFLTLSAFMMALTQRSRVHLIEFAMLFSWSILVFSRALMTIVLLQSFTFFLINSRASWQKKTALLTVLSLVFLVVFGVLGNARAEEFSILQSTGLGDLDPRYSIFVWVYAYLASPIANLALNMSVHSAQLKLVPTTFLIPLLPSAVQSWLGFETGFFAFSGYLAHDAFNVGTAFIQIYIDWGYFGVFLFDTVLGFFGHIVWNGYRRTGRADMLSLYIPCVVLTVFANQFTQLPVLLLFLLFGTLTHFGPQRPDRTS